MNIFPCYVTRRYNGLFLVTAFRPHMTTVAGTDHQDAYIKYSDPIGYINVEPPFSISVFDRTPTVAGEAWKAHLYGCTHEPPTHQVILNQEYNLYTIYCLSDQSIRINYVCPWFVKKLFGLSGEVDTPVYFKGRIR